MLNPDEREAVIDKLFPASGEIQWTKVGVEQVTPFTEDELKTAT